jgi:hypothetical protein
LRESTGDWRNAMSVICGNLRNLRTIVKAGTMGPLITQRVGARGLRVARTCGKWARDETTGREQGSANYANEREWI